jgi:hypothetical protein
METSLLVTNVDVETSDTLAFFAREAERALSALSHSGRDSHGEKAAFRVADGWLEILGASLASRGRQLPKRYSSAERVNLAQSTTAHQRHR